MTGDVKIFHQTFSSLMSPMNCNKMGHFLQLLMLLIAAASVSQGAPMMPEEIISMDAYDIMQETPTVAELTAFGTEEDGDGFEALLRVNEGITSGTKHYLLEGDILVTYNVSQVRPNAVRNRNVLWPNREVPYFIDSAFDAGARRRILAGIARYHAVTCLRFVPYTRAHRDYIHVVSRQGCYSAVGRQGGRQELSVGGACNFHQGTIVHEFMHAVGFQHEQTRTDRDQYVTVYYQNIQAGLAYNFARYGQDTIDHLRTEYDYNSVMHYPPYAFSSNGQATILPRRNGVSIGNKNDFSATDILKINRYYGCEETTGTGGEDGGDEEEEEETPSECGDSHRHCAYWARRGECSRSRDWMLQNCRASCRQCQTGSTSCTDNNGYCPDWAELGECRRNPQYMLVNCRQSCNVC